MTNPEYKKRNKIDYHTINVLSVIFNVFNSFSHVFSVFAIRDEFLQSEVDYINSSNLIKSIPQPPMMIVDKKNFGSAGLMLNVPRPFST